MRRSTENQLAVALQDEIEQGLVTVERRDGSVFVTVGSGGAFPSGSADLTGAATDILSRVAFASMTSNSEVTVTGHTTMFKYLTARSIETTGIWPQRGLRAWCNLCNPPDLCQPAS